MVRSLPQHRLAQAAWLTIVGILVACQGSPASSPGTAAPASPRPSVAADAPSRQPSPSSPAATPEPRETASEAPSASPEVAAYVLPPGAFAEVVVDGVRLREAPGTAASVLETLSRGQVVYLTGPPFSRAADGLEWRHVLWGRDYTGWPIPSPDSVTGWLASGADSTDYLALVDVDCPDGPPDLATLTGMTPWAWLSCFGNRELTVEGTVISGFGGYDPGTYEPGWLASPMGFTGAISDGRTGFFYYQPPDAERPNVADGQRLRITGHFDDAAAESCRMMTGTELHPEPEELAVLSCRERFVETAFEVLGE